MVSFVIFKFVSETGSVKGPEASKLVETQTCDNSLIGSSSVPSAAHCDCVSKVRGSDL
jgi:hypothetical protein